MGPHVRQTLEFACPLLIRKMLVAKTEYSQMRRNSSCEDEESRAAMGLDNSSSNVGLIFEAEFF